MSVHMINSQLNVYVYRKNREAKLKHVACIVASSKGHNGTHVLVRHDSVSEAVYLTSLLNSQSLMSGRQAMRWRMKVPQTWIHRVSNPGPQRSEVACSTARPGAPRWCVTEMSWRALNYVLQHSEVQTLLSNHWAPNLNRHTKSSLYVDLWICLIRKSHL